MNFESDNFYIEKVLNNDVSAYSSLIDKHKEMVYTIAFRILRNREDAEEIAQDTFIKAYQSLSKFRKESKFSTWLYRIVYNTAISRTRKKKIQTIELNDEIEKNFSEDEIRDDVFKLDFDEQKILINKVIGKLSEEDSLLITLYYFEENTTEEIAEITGLSQSNVKVRLHRVRKRLYEEIQEILNNEFKEVYP
ncbi:MAG: RNA polymerase sigma factor [Bacteroidales bacterium]|nr:RNA polymerase sigma factor [Bacteroidales bacterium]